MNNKVIMLGMIFGSIIGSYVPRLWGADAFSLMSIFTGGLGALLGIWLAYRLVN